MLEFENLHCHTYVSNAYVHFPDSPVGIKDYAKTYKDRGMQCLVASEHGYRGNVWEQADVAAEFGQKAICAAEVYFVPDRTQKDDRNFHLLLLAKNNDGFYQLNEILSESQLSGFYYHGRVDFDLLGRLDAKNFLCSTACVGGILKDPSGEKYANQLHEIFKENFRLEIQHHDNPVQKKHNELVMELYRKYKWPLLFCTDSHYVKPEDVYLRKELLASKKMDKIEDGSWKLYLPTAEEAYEMLLKQNVMTKAQIEEAFENTLEARTFEGFSYDTSFKLPISSKRKDMSVEERKALYEQMVWDGYRERFGEPTDWERSELQDEINIIHNTNMEDYFISLKDMLDRGVELGGKLTTTGRGSAASFASNAALGFTTMNRLRSKIKMYPERFITEDKLKVGCPD